MKSEKEYKLNILRERAVRNGIKFIDIDYSDRKNKRFSITLVNGETYHFGNPESNTFIDHGDEERRRAFHNRFKNREYYNDSTSPFYYSKILLW